jgi:hypothetical protein
VTASQDNLVRLLAALDLEDQVIGVALGDHLALQAKLHNYFLPSILHPLEHFCVLDCDSSGRDFRLILIVFMVSCVD